MSRSGGPTETRPIIESRARIGRKKEEGEDEGRGGMAMDLYTRSSSLGSLKQAWSGEDARAAAWLGGTLRDAGLHVS